MLRHSIGLFLITTTFTWAAEGSDPNTVIQMSPAAEVLKLRYSFVYPLLEGNDCNSLPLYQQAFLEDPNNLQFWPDEKWLVGQLALPAERMDIAAVKQCLMECRPVLELLEKASRCQRNRWPWISRRIDIDEDFRYDGRERADEIPRDLLDIQFSPQQYMEFLNQMQQRNQLLTLAIRYHIAVKEYEQACHWIRTGLAIARQMTRNSNLQLSMAAAADVSIILNQVELWTQTPGSPSLYYSLKELPYPFLPPLSMESLVVPPLNISMDMSMGMPGLPGMLMAPDEFSAPNAVPQADLLPDYTQTQAFDGSARIDRFIAVLECFEAVRYYLSVNGQMPQSLSDIPGLRLRPDPLTGGWFLYYRQDGDYILKSPHPRDNPAQKGFQYRIQCDK